MTAGKEPGLADLRKRYGEVTINEAWTLPALREKLREHPRGLKRHDRATPEP